jgi:hypothetical protein
VNGAVRLSTPIASSVDRERSDKAACLSSPSCLSPEQIAPVNPLIVRVREGGGRLLRALRLHHCRPGHAERPSTDLARRRAQLMAVAAPQTFVTPSRPTRLAPSVPMSRPSGANAAPTSVPGVQEAHAVADVRQRPMCRHRCSPIQAVHQRWKRHAPDRVLMAAQSQRHGSGAQGRGD